MRDLWKQSVWLVAAFGVISIFLWGTGTRGSAVAQTAVDPRFGAVESFWAASEAAELGVGWERILFYWNEIQPTGPNDWNTLHVKEEWLAEAQANGRQVVGLLKNTPNWATEGEFAAGVPQGLYLPVNDPGNLWANYVRRVAQYYAPLGVHHWIVWNEPDIAPNVYGHEFSGTTQDYYQLVKVAYQVMKQVDPAARIHLGGMTHWHDPGYLRRYLEVVVADPEAAANNYYFDAITFHIYFRPETITNIVGNAFYVQQQLGIDPMKPVWINETNARPSMDPEWPVQVESFQIDLDQQAWYIPQAFALGFYAGAARMAVYKLVDVNLPPGGESWGLIRPHDFSKRPAFYAYKTTIEHLSGFTYPIRREQSGTHYLFTFQRPQGVTRVMWARTQQPVTLQVPALAESALLVQTTGEATSITPVNGRYEIALEGARCYGECYMGGPPLFLVEEGVSGDPGSSTQQPGVAQPTATTATVQATATVTVTATTAATATATATTVPPTATATSSPTASPTATATATATAVPPTETPVPTETAVAEVASVPTAVATVAEEDGGETAVGGFIPGQASWWLLSLAGGVILMLLFIWRRVA